MCQICEEGFCARHHTTARDLLDFDPYLVSEREVEQQRENDLRSTVDFEQPMRDAL